VRRSFLVLIVALMVTTIVVGSTAAFAVSQDTEVVSKDKGNNKGKGKDKGQKKKTICHKGKTIEVGPKAAKKHLKNHEEDFKGACELVT
jgi:hypothetical protein